MATDRETDVLVRAMLRSVHESLTFCVAADKDKEATTTQMAKKPFWSDTEKKALDRALESAGDNINVFMKNCRRWGIQRSWNAVYSRLSTQMGHYKPNKVLMSKLYKQTGRTEREKKREEQKVKQAVQLATSTDDETGILAKIEYHIQGWRLGESTKEEAFDKIEGLMFRRPV